MITMNNLLFFLNPNRNLLAPSLRINRPLPTHLTRLLRRRRRRRLWLRGAHSVVRIDQTFHQERPADCFSKDHR